MKPRNSTPFRSHASITAAFSVALFCHLATPSALALTYYWDSNGATAGFGTAAGTWAAPTTGDATQGWSEDGTGATEPVSVTTATGDVINFGNVATGLAAGTINVSGTVASGNMTFASGSGAVLLSGGTITLAAASTITVDNSTSTINSILAGASGIKTKAGTGTLVFSGANTYAGTTAINAGTLQVNTGGTLGATAAALTMGTGSDGVAGTVGNLTLNTSAQVAGITVKSNSGTAGLLTIASGSTLTASSLTAGISTVAANVTTNLSTGAAGTGGTLTVNGNVTVGLTAGNASVKTTTDVNLSGLQNFNVTSTGGSLTVGSINNAAATLTLANNANTINVGTLSVGSTAGNYNVADLSTLTLGAGTNALQAPSIILGQGKANGRMIFAGANGSVTITGANGAGTSNITIGNATTAVYAGGGTSTLALAGHTATVSAGTVNIGQKSGTATSGNLPTSLTFDTGTFTASTIQMAVASAGSSILTSTLTVGGASANSAATGVMTIGGNLLLAAATAGTATPASTLTINGGTVNVNNTTPTAGEGIFDTSTAGASTTTLTLEGGTLNLNGGTIGGTTGTGKRNITNLNFRSGTLKNVAQINGGAAITKSTSGTLLLAGTNTYTGATNISAGTLILSAADSTNGSSGITIDGSGAKFLQTSSVAVSPAVTVTNGTLTGSGTLNTVGVGDATGGIISNNDGVAGASLTIGALTFNGAATVNTFGNASTPLVTTTLATTAVGLVTINPTAASWTTGTTYDLISYTGSIGGGDFAQFTLGTVTGTAPRQSATLVNTGTAVAVQIGGTTDFPYWVGDTNSQWDTTTINNWKLVTAGTYTNFIPTDVVLFDDNAAGAGSITVNIDAADVATTSTTFNNTITRDYFLNSTGSFGISEGSLTKNGTGNVTISTVNTYTGTTTVNNGTLTLSGNRTAPATGGFNVGTVPGNTGTLNVTNGSFTVGSTGSTFNVGSVAGSTGILNQSGTSSLTTSGNQLLIGNHTSTGTYNLSGGTLTTIAGSLGVTIGTNTGSTGTFSLSGAGVLTMPATSTLQITRSDDNVATGVTGTFAQTGGTATVGILKMGGGGATNNATANATLSLTGGTFAATTFNMLSGGDNSTSAITIGGTAQVTLPAFPTNAKGAGATATITFDSTTGFLSPSAASATYLPAGTFTNAYLTANGAKFNVPVNITIGQALENAVSPAAVGTLTKDGVGTLTLSGANTYTGTTTIAAGTLSLGSVSALGGTSGLTLGGASAATLSSSLTGITISAPITTADTGVISTIAFGLGSAAAGGITLNGAIGGNGNVTFTTTSISSGGHLQTINLGATGTYAGSTILNTGNSNNALTLRNSSGAANVIPATTVLSFGTGAGGGTGRTTTFDLNGQNQTLAGLSNAGSVPVDRNQMVSSSTAATLTINNTADFTFGGSTLEVGGNTTTTRAQITGAIALTKSGAGTFTLGGTLLNSASVGGNTYTGNTKILAGILVLGETTSIQNSAFDTTNSILGAATNGLRSSVTTLTLGGLIGSNNFASRFTTTTGGYSDVTALTLNPGTGATPSYSGGIANGAAGMTLTKSGAGTQTLSGTNTYTGATTVSAGTLALVGGSQDSPITVNNLASLGFTLSSGTTSTSTVTFDVGSTVTITGTPAPATSYTLLTTSATISGTPVLAAPIPGFDLQVDGTNTLKLVPVAGGYSSWQSANSTAQAANLDHDNDGVSNGVEYFLGGTTNTTGFTALPGVTNTAGVLSVTWTKAASYTGTYGTDFWVETSATLTGAWATELADPAVGFTVTFPTATEVKYTFPAGTKNFARLKVTGP